MKLFVFGFNHLSGVSKKTNSEYNFYQVDTLSRRNQGFGAPLIANVMAIQAPAFENILSDYINDKAVFPVLLSAEFDNRGTLVEASKVNDGDEATAELVSIIMAVPKNSKK